MLEPVLPPADKRRKNEQSMSIDVRSLAVLVSLVVLLIAVWVVRFGIGHYTDDYCYQAFELCGQGGGSISGPRFTSPITLSCYFEGYGWKSTTDLRPMAFASIVLGVPLGVIVAFWIWVAYRRR